MKQLLYTSLLLIITLRFTCSEMKIFLNLQKVSKYYERDCKPLMLLWLTAHAQSLINRNHCVKFVLILAINTPVNVIDVILVSLLLTWSKWQSSKFFKVLNTVVNFELIFMCCLARFGGVIYFLLNITKIG